MVGDFYCQSRVDKPVRRSGRFNFYGSVIDLREKCQKIPLFLSARWYRVKGPRLKGSRSYTSRNESFGFDRNVYESPRTWPACANLSNNSRNNPRAQSREEKNPFRSANNIFPKHFSRNQFAMSCRNEQKCLFANKIGQSAWCLRDFCAKVTFTLNKWNANISKFSVIIFENNL